jgi:hypothetical protein
MQVKIDLGRVQTLPDLPLSYEEGMHDVRPILSDVCEALADTASADFVASGFGQARWPVDVRTDLPVFLEQLPEAIASAEAGLRSRSTSSNKVWNARFIFSLRISTTSLDVRAILTGGPIRTLK